MGVSANETDVTWRCHTGRSVTQTGVSHREECHTDRGVTHPQVSHSHGCPTAPGVSRAAVQVQLSSGAAGADGITAQSIPASSLTPKPGLQVRLRLSCLCWVSAPFPHPLCFCSSPPCPLQPKPKTITRGNLWLHSSHS